MAAPRLHLISAGAAQGLVRALEPQFRADTGAEIDGSFGAVGAMREKLLAGAPCDVIILTRALIDQLATEGRVLPETIADLGIVKTGIAVPEAADVPDVDSPEALRAALLAASAVYFPDPKKATAGIHFAKVLEQLEIHAELQSRLRSFPNGATAMKAMAEAGEVRAVGCTQVTEILATPGVTLVGLLPKEFELATLYTAAVCRDAVAAQPATQLVRWLTAAAARDVRQRAGFD